MILAVIEQQQGTLNRISWEAVAAAQQLGQTTSQPVVALVLGSKVRSVADETAAAQVERVLVVDDPLLDQYTPDAYSSALTQVIEAEKPRLVVMAHTYQTRDFAPKLGASLKREFLGDCIGFRADEGTLIFTRQLFQGRMNADIAVTSASPCLVSVQAGSFRADQVTMGASRAPVEDRSVTIPPETVRTKPLERFQEAKRTVDLGQAEIIVSVGRGIKEQENLPLVQKLADALGAELGGSRPICDNGWLPMERQIGSSGQTVAPRLYLAVGISGAIQHLVGMKGARTVVAINKDPHAPIFEVADYGIVGNLFDIVPALIEEITKLRAK
jgi:electron transfer flavoprotein alpha subunit